MRLQGGEGPVQHRMCTAQCSTGAQIMLRKKRRLDMGGVVFALLVDLLLSMIPLPSTDNHSNEHPRYGTDKNAQNTQP